MQMAIFICETVCHQEVITQWEADLRNVFNPHIYLDNFKLYSLMYGQKPKGLLYPSGLALTFLWVPSLL